MRPPIQRCSVCNTPMRPRTITMLAAGIVVATACPDGHESREQYAPPGLVITCYDPATEPFDAIVQGVEP